MQEFMDRPYRDTGIRKQRKVKAAKYHEHMKTMKKDAAPQSGVIFVPPELTDIAEASLAGASTSHTEDPKSGPTPKG